VELLALLDAAVVAMLVLMLFGTVGVGDMGTAVGPVGVGAVGRVGVEAMSAIGVGTIVVGTLGAIGAVSTVVIGAAWPMEQWCHLCLTSHALQLCAAMCVVGSGGSPCYYCGFCQCLLLLFVC
jgi:hypothetical protein